MALEPPAKKPPQGTTRRIALLLLLSIPFGYFGMIFAVIVHEVLGHGLVAEALGGHFWSFQIDFDGMGSAHTTSNSLSTGAENAVLLGGVVSTTLVGTLLLVAGIAVRQLPHVAIPLLLISMGLLLEGPPYAFWNSVHPVPPGDLGRIFASSPATTARMLTIVASGLVMALAILALTAASCRSVEIWLWPVVPPSGSKRLLFLALLGGLPGAGWFVFDWNQLAPGINAWPNFVGLALHLVCALSLYRVRFDPVEQMTSNRNMVIAIVAGWLLAFGTVAAIALWLRDGITWA